MTEKRVDKFSFELIESSDFNRIADKIEDTEKFISDSLLDKYMDSLKIIGDTTFLGIKTDFEKHKLDNDGYLFNKIEYCPFCEINPAKCSSILGRVDINDTFDLLFRLNNYRIKEIFHDSLKWYFDLIKINNKETCILLLLKNNPIHLFFDLKYVDCINLIENEEIMSEGMVVGYTGKSYSIKIRMNDKINPQLREFKDNECFVVKIKVLNDYFYFFRSVKQLKENKEFDISNYSRNFSIRNIRWELKDYTKIISEKQHK